MDPISVVVAFLLVEFGIIGGFLAVRYMQERHRNHKVYESDFMKTLERRKILQDDGEFHSLPLPFVPINPELMTALCMATGERKAGEPEPRMEKNLLRFKRPSWGFWKRPVEAEMMRCNSRFAVMDIGHASHVYLLKRGRYLKKNSEYHIVGMIFLTLNLSESRVDWLAKKFPYELHHQKELPPFEETKIEQFPKEDEMTSRIVESDFLDTLGRRKLLGEDEKFTVLPLPFLRIASASSVAGICKRFGKRNDDEPEPHLETNLIRFERSGSTRSQPVEAEMMRCSSQYAVMDIGHASTAYLLKLGQFKKSHNGRPLFSIIKTLRYSLELSLQRLKWLAEKFPEETHHWEELPEEKETSNDSFSEMRGISLNSDSAATSGQKPMRP